MTTEILSYRCVAGDCPAKNVNLSIEVSVPPDNEWISKEDLGDPLCAACDNNLDSFTPDHKPVYNPLAVFKIRGEVENNTGKIIIECGVSRQLFNEFFEKLYGKDYPEGGVIRAGDWKAQLTKNE